MMHLFMMDSEEMGPHQAFLPRVVALNMKVGDKVLPIATLHPHPELPFDVRDLAELIVEDKGIVDRAAMRTSDRLGARR